MRMLHLPRRVGGSACEGLVPAWCPHEQRTHCPLLAGGHILSQALAPGLDLMLQLCSVFSHHRVGLLGRTEGGKLESHTEKSLYLYYLLGSRQYSKEAKLEPEACLCHKRAT